MSRSLRVATAVGVYAAVIAGTAVAGSALHPHSANSATSIPAGACPLVTTTRQSGRAIVTYADNSNDPRVAQAVQTAVANWNQSLTNVRLVADPNFAAVSIRAGDRNEPIATCPSSTARTVVITLSTPRWDATSGPNAVVDPAASMARDLGRALGLPSGGTCPDLMSSHVCASRNASPTAREVAIVNALYAPRPKTP